MFKSILIGSLITVFLAACSTVQDMRPHSQTVKVAQIGPGSPLTTHKYEPLVFGKEKPLVCGEVYPAKGALSCLPNLQVMWESYIYPRPDRIWGEIGGMVEKNGTLSFENGGVKLVQCSGGIKLSRAV
jgi:hypothetical protein